MDKSIRDSLDERHKTLFDFRARMLAKQDKFANELTILDRQISEVQTDIDALNKTINSFFEQENEKIVIEALKEKVMKQEQRRGWMLKQRDELVARKENTRISINYLYEAMRDMCDHPKKKFDYFDPHKREENYTCLVCGRTI